MMFIDIIGWIGAILLATCGLPQLWKSMKTKEFSGLSMLFIFGWGMGELLTLLYVLDRAFRLPLVFNYLINIIAVFAILGVYLKYGRK